MKIFKLYVCALIGLILLSGCVGFPRDTLGSLSELGSEETLVVGRVEIVPDLLDSEQTIKLLGNTDYWKKTMFILTSEENREIRGKLKESDQKNQIRAELNKNFYVSNANKSFFIIGGMLYQEISAKYENKLIFPGGYKVSIKPGDKAVYIGTLQYHRNEYLEITKMFIVDDYERANAEFKKKYGVKYSLRKALLTPSS
ncbi:MAG TPA: hypothetical protein VMV48_00865 [Gallionellaceae bacterium]|nr:hypothetical protein [Gallionellaceae bacterium]